MRGFRDLTCILAAAGATGNVATAQITNDYPRAALREGREGVAQFTVEISEAGRAENCVITGSTGWPDLDEATCKVIHLRARFNPANDETGRPMRSSYTGRLVWKIPK